MNLKKFGNLFTNKFVVTGRGPRLIKKDSPSRGLKRAEKHWSSGLVFSIAIATMAYIVVEGDFLQRFLIILLALKHGRSALNVIIMLGLSDHSK
jgi:hypothetical protein